MTISVRRLRISSFSTEILSTSMESLRAALPESLLVTSSAETIFDQQDGFVVMTSIDFPQRFFGFLSNVCVT